MRMLDLFCGRGGWTNAFLARGWECVGVDLNPQPEYKGQFIQRDVLTIGPEFVKEFDFVCASSPCEEFSIHGMKCFHPNPPFPDMGLVLFCWTRRLLDNAGITYVMENVRPAHQFVGKASHKCGPFYLWGNGVPLLMAQGITKGTKFGLDKDGSREGRKKHDPYYNTGSSSKARREYKAKIAEIPPELANCVADYAERLLEMKVTE